MNKVVKNASAANRPSFLRLFNRRLEEWLKRQESWQDLYGQPVTVTEAVVIGSTRMGAYHELKEGLLGVNPSSIEEITRALHQAYSMQYLERSLQPLSSLGAFADVARRVYRRMFGFPQNPEHLAWILGNRVAGYTIFDWIDELLLDVDVVRDPLWLKAVRSKGLDSVRRAVARRIPLARGFPDLNGPGEEPRRMRHL